MRTADGDHRILHADVVVATADLHHVETTLLPRPLQTYPESWWRRRTSGPGAVLVLLGVRGELPQLQHHTLLFTRDWHENFGAIREGRVPSPASSYVCRPSATDPSVAPPGHENLFVLVPVPSDPSLGHGGEDGTGSPAVERIADEAIARIAEQAGVPDLAERIVVRRTVGPAEFAEDLGAWRGSMLGPAHTLRQSAFFRAGNASRRVTGLLYAGSSTLPGIGLPMCLISAELIAKRLRGDRSSAPLPEPAAADGHEQRGRRLMAGLYLAALLVPSGCMVLLDRRFRLVLWSTPQHSARALVLTLGIGIVFFLLWDLAAIASGHYRTGQSPAMTGIELLPDLPLEELVLRQLPRLHDARCCGGWLACAMPRR